MKKAAVLAGMAVLAAAGSAFGQTGAATAAATLQMRIVPVDVTSASPLNLSYQNDSTHNTVLATDAGTNRIRRFTVQYRIQEGAGFEGAIASLSALQFNITATTSNSGLANVGFDRAALSRAQGSNTVGGGAVDSGDPVPGTDATGNTTGTFAGVTGLHRAWRGGLDPAGAGGNGLPSNGTIAANGIFLITPLTLTQLNQFPADNTSAWYGIYDFTVIVGDSTQDVTVNLAVNSVADQQTGSAWGGYEDGINIPQTSRNFTGFGASFDVQAVPAPGSLALIGLGGLVAARRRRA